METSDLKGKTNIQGGEIKYIINLNLSFHSFISIQEHFMCMCTCGCFKSWKVLVRLQINFLEELVIG